jgi:asparagine synthetase B (glutamine-hydrolysing)
LDNISKRYYLYTNSSASYGTPSEIRYSPICHAFSVNICTPFCDRNVKEFGASLPMKYKHPSRDLSKYILRKVALKYDLLPSKFIESYNKKGFSSPVEIWMKGETKEYIGQATLNDIQFCGNIFNETYIKRLLNTNRSRQVLSIYLFSQWCKNYFNDANAD